MLKPSAKISGLLILVGLVFSPVLVPQHGVYIHPQNPAINLSVSQQLFYWIHYIVSTKQFQQASGGTNYSLDYPYVVTDYGSLPVKGNISHLTVVKILAESFYPSASAAPNNAYKIYVYFLPDSPSSLLVRAYVGDIFYAGGPTLPDSNYKWHS